MTEITSVDKFIKDEKEASSDKSHERSYAREAAVNRGGNEFTDQFYSQHMRFYKGVCHNFFSRFKNSRLKRRKPKLTPSRKSERRPASGRLKRERANTAKKSSSGESMEAIG